jgi:hypothetical protein
MLIISRSNCLYVMRIYSVILATCLLLFASGYFFQDYVENILRVVENQVRYSRFYSLIYLCVSWSRGKELIRSTQIR